MPTEDSLSHRWWKSPAMQDIVVGLTIYVVTTGIVLGGIHFGAVFLTEQRPPPQGEATGFLTRMSRWDGVNYLGVVHGGYFYTPGQRSNVAFFPAYPLLGRQLAAWTGIRPEASLALIAHVFLAGCFVLLRTYARLRFPEAGPPCWNAVVLVFGVFPTTFFFRMLYTESMFAFVLLLALMAMDRRWPPLIIALIVGLATATRPVGVALIPGFALHLFSLPREERGSLVAAALYLPVAAWGLLAYMAFQAAAFDEPLAFAKTQDYWADPDLAAAPPRWLSLLTLEPIFGVYDPASFRYWRMSANENPLFSIASANPLYFLFALAVVIVGWARARLNSAEAVIGLGLLLIPYTTKGYDYSMSSHGRFAALALPVYLVIGMVVGNSRWLALAAAVSGCLMFWYAALFSAGYLIF